MASHSRTQQSSESLPQESANIQIWKFQNKYGILIIDMFCIQQDPGSIPNTKAIYVAESVNWSQMEVKQL
jgi:hypothetical protein